MHIHTRTKPDRHYIKWAHNMIPSALDGKVTDKSCSEIYAPEDVVFEGKNKLLPSLPSSLWGDCSPCSSQSPTEHFTKFRASKTVGRHFWTTYTSYIAGCWGSKIMKCLVRFARAISRGKSRETFFLSFFSFSPPTTRSLRLNRLSKKKLCIWLLPSWEEKDRETCSHYQSYMSIIVELVDLEKWEQKWSGFLMEN